MIPPKPPIKKPKIVNQGGNTSLPSADIKALFKEILVRHVVLSELRDIYRAKLNALLDV